MDAQRRAGRARLLVRLPQQCELEQVPFNAGRSFMPAKLAALVVLEHPQSRV
jgi:hypothetical protein